MRKRMRQARLLICCIMLTTLWTSSCGGNGTATMSLNPTPAIASLSPTTEVAGGARFLLSVSGSGFVSSSAILWNGSSRNTVVITNGQLNATIAPSDIATAGAIRIQVSNPAPGGGTSGIATLTVNNPQPSNVSLSPTTEVAGGAGFVLTVNGSGFVAGSTVLWNGNSRPTTMVSSTQLNATISASDIATVGSVQIQISNPIPGGGLSGVAILTVNNPQPSLVSFLPFSANSGDPGFALALDGSNFVSGSVVQWNGNTRSTTFVDSNHLTAAIPMSDIATSGIAQISVVNPLPGGGASPALRFEIAAPGPTPIFLYVPNVSSNNIFGYSVDNGSGVLTALAGSPFASTPLATQAGTMLLDHNGKFLYMVNNATSGCKTCGSVSAFAVGSTGALLPLVGSPFTNILAPMAQDPSGNIVYTASGDKVYSSLIDANSGMPMQIAVGPFDGLPPLTVYPSGAFLYAVTVNGISIGSVSSTTGQVSAVPGSSFGGASALAVDPSGKFAFAVAPSALSSFAIDPASGSLGLLNSTNFSFPITLASVLAHPSGKFLYVTDQGNNTIMVFTIAANGTLTPVSGSPFSAGTGAINPYWMATDSNGKFLFVANLNGTQPNSSISAFTVDPVTGGLTPGAGSPFPTPAAPGAIVVGP